MKAALESRLKRLEGRALVSREPFTVRFGPLRCLPREYVGERHVAILKQLPSEAPDRERYEFEERPGPGPGLFSDKSITVFFVTPEQQKARTALE
jgi:hypothetical protein